MRSLRILIFSFLFLTILLPENGLSQPWSVRSGMYIFTDNTASEFYLLAPTVLGGFDVWKRSRLSMNLSTGLSFNSLKYDDHRHNLYMVPVNLLMVYDIPNPGAKVWPVAGSGICLTGKADQNESFSKTHYSLSYGFLATAGIRIPLSKKLIFVFDLTYNLLIPPTSDEINMSGMMVMVGLKW